MDDMPIIPIYTYTSKHLIHPSVEGLHSEPDGFSESQVRAPCVPGRALLGMALSLTCSASCVWRLLQALPVIFVVITATFLSGALSTRGPFRPAKKQWSSPRSSEHSKPSTGLDLPLHEQYFAYLGDLGTRRSEGPPLNTRAAASTKFWVAGLPVTAELGLYALILRPRRRGDSPACLRGAETQYTRRTYVPMGLAMIGICMPSFLLGPLLVLVFGIWLDWLPIAGWGDHSRG